MEKKKDSKLLLAYLISIVGAILLFVEKDATEEYKDHYRQAAVIFGLTVITSACASFIPFVGILSTLLFVASIVCGIKAYNGEDFKMPIISDIAKSIFKK